MTVTTTNTRAELNGNASAGPFQCGFRILTDSDLLVYVEGVLKTLTTHYTVANAGTTTNATVTFTSGNYPASGTANVVLVRSVPYTQTADYQNNTALDAETLETSFDRGTMQIQQNISNSDRALKFGDTVTGVTSSVTDISTGATSRANKILGFDSSGNISATLELGTNRGNWATSTAYVVRDLVKQNNGADSGTYGNIYLCITAHTSTGAHVTASDSANWQLIVDAASTTTSATASATSATASATSATASATSATASATSATASATSATASATSATASATSATASAASATASSASEVAARNSAASVANSYDSFDDLYLGTMSDAISFTADASTNFLTSNAHGLVDTQIIRVSGSDLPSGLSASTNYYVLDKTTNTFKLATSSGGTEINIVDNGTGTNTWYYADFITPTSSTWSKDSSTISVASNVGVRVGQVVSGSGIPTSPKPNVLSITGSGPYSVVISGNMAAASVDAGSGGAAVTFANRGVYGEFNTTKESFTVRKIIPLSDLTATVQFKKSSGKIGLAFFYWIKSSGGYWQYFFPTDSHIIGMNRMKDMLHNVEQHNFDKNFI